MVAHSHQWRSMLSNNSAEQTARPEDGESLIADVRSRMRPSQAVERKLGAMLGRDRNHSTLQLSSETGPSQILG